MRSSVKPVVHHVDEEKGQNESPHIVIRHVVNKIVVIDPLICYNMQLS